VRLLALSYLGFLREDGFGRPSFEVVVPGEDLPHEGDRLPWVGGDPVLADSGELANQLVDVRWTPSVARSVPQAA
jgi:hypothetical protein